MNGRSVEVRDMHFEKALRKFKKKVSNTGILYEVRQRQFYIKPTEQRQIRLAAAKRRWAKHVEKQTLRRR